MKNLLSLRTFSKILRVTYHFFTYLIYGTEYNENCEKVIYYFTKFDKNFCFSEGAHKIVRVFIKI